VRQAVLSFRRLVPAFVLAGAFALLLTGPASADDGGPDPGTPAPPSAPSVPTPHESVSTRTVLAAATLPGAGSYLGVRSVKHTRLTTVVYRTMKQLGSARRLAVACWDRSDWESVLQAEGEQPASSDSVLQGLWVSRQPRWLHLSPDVCTDVQGLLDSGRPNARRADALTAVVHEALHAHGVSNEAQTNCYAVQFVPEFARNLKLDPIPADYLAKLARTITRAHAPRGYWNDSRCRDGGSWDLAPDRRNLD
jgi:hypothetical protein